MCFSVVVSSKGSYMISILFNKLGILLVTVLCRARRRDIRTEGDRTDT